MVRKLRWAVLAAPAVLLAGCASLSLGDEEGVALDELRASDAAGVETLLGAAPDFVAREGERLVRRYDLRDCALLVYFDAEAPTAPVRAVTATDAAGSLAPEVCLDRARG